MKRYRVIKREYNVSGKTCFIIQKYKWLFGWYWDDQRGVYGIGYLYLYYNKEEALKMCAYLNGEITYFTNTVI